MLQDSNNFIANQLLLILAYEKKGEGVDISDGAEIVTRFLKNKIGIQPDDINLVEGSGISTRNSIDLLAMLKVMNYFNEYRELLPHLRYSKFSELAKAGRKWNILAKSGTLSNISTLAGFIQTDEKEWKPFVIMLNNTGKARGTVIDIIGRYYNG
jgi:D-alanyl-D-alanine carboxypeptidase/D-alanyl-D-alanine-endopeptidase (penicillin-binding protein 4)